MVKLLLKKCADVNEMGVAIIDAEPENLKWLLCILSKRVGRIFCRSCSIMGLVLTRQTVRV